MKRLLLLIAIVIIVSASIWFALSAPVFHSTNNGSSELELSVGEMMDEMTSLSEETWNTSTETGDSDRYTHTEESSGMIEPTTIYSDETNTIQPTTRSTDESPILLPVEESEKSQD